MPSSKNPEEFNSKKLSSFHYRAYYSLTKLILQFGH